MSVHLSSLVQHSEPGHSSLLHCTIFKPYITIFQNALYQALVAITDNL